MENAGNIKYLSEQAYRELVDMLRCFTGIILLSLAKHSAKTKDNTIRNFIARGMEFVESILYLWRIGNYDDCWVLHRSLLDRLFHLWALDNEDEFELFEKWCFIRQYEDRNRQASDPFAKSKLRGQDLAFTQKEKRRYAQLKKEDVQWERPNTEKIAKTINLPFLYRYGYDYGSSHVHPMAGEGENVFTQLTSKKAGCSADQKIVLHNSIGVQLLLIQEGLNASTLSWMAIVYDFLDNCRKSLENGSQKYCYSFAKIANSWPKVQVCKPSSK